MNYEKCKCVQQIGQVAVYVKPECPNAHLIKGYFAVTKTACRKCQYCRKDGNELQKASEKK